jgi:hypothetical protein
MAKKRRGYDWYGTWLMHLQIKGARALRARDKSAGVLSLPLADDDRRGDDEHDQLAEVIHAASNPCPVCGAEPGDQCATASSQVSNHHHFHPDRVDRRPVKVGGGPPSKFGDQTDAMHPIHQRQLFETTRDPGESFATWIAGLARLKRRPRSPGPIHQAHQLEMPL